MPSTAALLKLKMLIPESVNRIYEKEISDDDFDVTMTESCDIQIKTLSNKHASVIDIKEILSKQAQTLHSNMNKRARNGRNDHGFGISEANMTSSMQLNTSSDQQFQLKTIEDTFHIKRTQALANTDRLPLQVSINRKGSLATRHCDCRP